MDYTYGRVFRTYLYYYANLILELVTNVLVSLSLVSRQKPPLHRLDGQTAIVTGGNRGIGEKIVWDLSSRGARVIIACRDVKRGLFVKKEIESHNSSASIQVGHLDLRSQQSIYSFCKDVIFNEHRLDVLVNNAGTVSFDRIIQDDSGIEMTFAVNYLALVSLTMTLMDKMMLTSPDPRIINVSSVAHSQVAHVDWTDLSLTRTGRLWWKDGYCDSKLAGIWFSQELAKRTAKFGLRVYVVDPGSSQTAMYDKIGFYWRALLTSTFARPFHRSIESAADSVVHAVVHPREEYDHRHIFFKDGYRKRTSFAGEDVSLQERCWKETMSILKICETIW